MDFVFEILDDWLDTIEGEDWNFGKDRDYGIADVADCHAVLFCLEYEPD